MRKVISVFICIALLTNVVGCATVDNNLNEASKELKEARAKYKEYKQKYKKLKAEYLVKREFVRRLIDMYVGESWEAKKSESGIQDLVFKRVKSDSEAFTPEQKEKLAKADKKVKELVDKLAQMDKELQELDKKVKKGFEKGDKFLTSFKEAIEKAEDINNRVEKVGSIVLQSLKLGTVVAQ